MEKLVHQITTFLGGMRLFKVPPKNWVLKCISLLFALFLWYFVAGENKVDVNISVPVEIVNLPHKLIISNQYRKQLDVLVSGQRSIIRAIADQHVTRSIDLSKAIPGKIVVTNTLDSISLPRGISILRIYPESLTFLIDRLIEKNLPIKPLLTGTPPDGFQILDVEVEPSTIRIHGPETVLAQEESIQTAPIDQRMLTKDIAIPVSLQLKPVLAELVGEQIVTVSFDVDEKRLRRKIYNIPLTTIGLQKDQTVRPAAVSLVAKIPVSIIKRTKNLQTIFKATIPQGPYANDTVVDIHVTTSAGISEDRIKIEKITPEQVTVLKKADTLTPRSSKRKKTKK